MKRSFRILTLVCAAMSILASCAKEETDPDSGKPAGPEPDQTYEYVFSLNEAALTRASLSEQAVLFEEGDKLGVIAVTPEKTTVTEAEVFHAEGTANIAFEITQKKGIEKDDLVCAFYPVAKTSTPSGTKAQLTIPAEQNQTESTYDADAMPLVSVPFTAEATLPTGRKNEAGQLTMTAVGAVAEFEIYSTFPGFESQEIVAVEWEAEGLAGNFTWDFAAENPTLGTLAGNKAKTAVETTKAVAATKAEAAKIYMVVAPGQHTGTVKVTTVAGEYTLTLAEALTLEAGKVTPIEVNLENTTWSESKIYRYRFTATAADELFGGLTQTVGFFAGEENIEKTLAEGAFTYDLDAPLAADASFYAYYPYNAEATAANELALCIPANQTNPADGGYDKSYIPVVAAPAAVSGTANSTEPNGTFEFHSLASVLKLNFFSANAAATEEKLESVTLAAEGAAGNFTWDLTATQDSWTFGGLDAATVTAAPAEPTAIGATAENAASVYLVLSPGTQNGVLTVKTNQTSYEFTLNAELTRAETHEFNIKLPTSSKGFGATLEEFEIVELPSTFSKGVTAELYGVNQQKTTIAWSEGGFEAEDHVKGPYYAIYPEGAGTVNFNDSTFCGTVAAEQTLAEGKKVVDNAFTYFAKSNSPALAFKNATSLVKVAVLNENVSTITLTAKEGQSIAGDYTLTIAEDNVTVAVAEGKGTSSITLKPAGATFARGEYYIAVIPGATENLTVDFTIGEEKATKALTIETIARNTAADLGKFLGYDIANAEELLAWNNDNKNWTKWDVVTLTDNIDCAGVITSENWTVLNFSGTLDGNSKTIKNFVIEKDGPAAFFGRVTNATITNLTFDETCSFTTTGTTGETPTDGYAKNRMYAASLLCDATQGTTLRNITNYARVDATTTSASNGNYIGGICAYNDATVGATNCKNYGHISYSSPSTSSWVNVAGCFGHTTKEITLEGCENHGLVQFLGTNSGNKSLNLAGISGGCMSLTLKSCKNNGKIECKATKTHSGGTNIGGFIGLVNSRDVTTTFENCENTTNGTLINSSQSGSNVAIGGSIGNIMGSTSENNPFSSKVSISNFKNYGAIQNTATVSGILALGGIAGMISTASENHISSCENHGEIINTGGFSSRLYLGGIVGLLNNASTNISNVKNSGNLETTKGSAKTDGTGNIAMGGILGATVSTAEAHAITNAQNSGNLSFKTAETKDGLQMGGILGFCEKSNITIGGEIENNLINSGNITSTKKSRHLGIGGVVGRIFGSATVNTIQNANNTGAVNHTSWLDNGAQPMWHGIGGILGAHSTEVSSTSTINVKKCHNEGRIDKLGGDGTVNDIHVGGIIGNIASIATTDDSKCESIGNIEDCTNSGIICNDSGKGTGNGKYAATGGIIGQMWCQGAIKNCTNSGSVINKVTTNGNENIRVGGIIGCIRGAYTVVNCDNTGEVKDESLSTGGMMGGIIGGIYIAAIQQLENCDNSGNLSASFNSASSGTVFMGGIVGYNIRAIALNNSATAAKNCHNTGNIANNRTTAGAEYVGGWIGYSKWKVLAENCSSSSTIKTAYPTTTKYIGAFAGHLDANNSNIKNCQVGGSFNETPLTADNFASLCFGTDSKYKTTSSITLK